MGRSTPPRALAGIALAMAVAACSGLPGATIAPTLGGPPTVAEPWPAPADPAARAQAAGLALETKESVENHVHAHLDVFIDGKAIRIPAGIGINTKDPEVKTFDGADGSPGYAGIELCGQPCISPLHTHYATGILHTESSTAVTHTLGQFFDEWGVVLSATCVAEHCSPSKAVAFYVNGQAYGGDPRAIELTDQKEIAVVIGTPPAVIPATADFSQD